MRTNAPFTDPLANDPVKLARFGRLWQLAVVDALDVAPQMRRARLTTDDLQEFKPRVAQQLVFQIPAPDLEPLRRHYTIRRFDPHLKIIEVDVVMHGHNGPGAAWARAVRAGETIRYVDPAGGCNFRPAPAGTS